MRFGIVPLTMKSIGAVSPQAGRPPGGQAGAQCNPAWVRVIFGRQERYQRFGIVFYGVFNGAFNAVFYGVVTEKRSDQGMAALILPAEKCTTCRRFARRNRL